MKKTITTVLVLMTTCLCLAQTDYSKSLSGIEWVKITSKSNISVMVHDKNEILIKGSHRAKASEKAKGLRLVGVGGTVNTNVGFNVVEEGNALIVTNLRKNESAKIYLPKNQKVAVTSTWNGNISIDGFSDEIEATCELNGGMKLNNISGPLTASSLNGEIDVIFDTISQDSPTSLNTTNGAIDVSLSGNTSADISMSSWNGDMYSNFDIKSSSDKDGLKKVSSRRTNGTINGGGVSITLKSTNGNIYLRKK
ncbi:MAG: DUF4097 family beta strand repeat-containing protein [Bacteroidota bacterium]